jgi:hypothetical protein
MTASIQSEPNKAMKHFNNAIRSAQLEFPRLGNMLNRKGKATP